MHNLTSIDSFTHIHIEGWIPETELYNESKMRKSPTDGLCTRIRTTSVGRANAGPCRAASMASSTSRTATTSRPAGQRMNDSAPVPMKDGVHARRPEDGRRRSRASDLEPASDAVEDAPDGEDGRS